MARSSTRLVLTSLDQLVSSLGNFVLVFSLARTASPAEFGIYALGIAVLSFGLAIGRSVIATPFTIDSIATETTAGASAAVSMGGASNVSVARSSAFALVVGGVMAGVMAPFVVGAAWSSTRLAEVLALFMLSLPLLMFQDLLRYVAIARSRPAAALMSDATWTAIVLGLLCYQIVAVRPADARVCAAIWVLGLVLATAVLVLAGLAERPRSHGLAAWVRADRRHLQLTGDALMSGGGPIVLLSLVGVLCGPSVVAALRGASTIFGPFSTLLNAITLALVPEVRRHRHPRGERLLLGATSLTCVGILSFGLVMAFLVPQRVGTALLGSTWALTHEVLRATTVEYLGMALMTAGVVWCRAKNRVDVSLRVQGLQWVAWLAATTGTALLFGTAIAVAIGLAAVGVSAGIASLATARRLAYER